MKFAAGTVLLALSTGSAFLSTGSALAQSPVGDWLVEDGSARIRIADCAPTLWGLMVAEKSPSTDDNNPDAKLRGRPMIGVPMLLNLKQANANLWTGKIYDPIGTAVTSGGKYYDVKISLAKNGKLEVRGCIGSIFCGGQDWTRITDPNAEPTPPAGSIFAQKAMVADSKATKPVAKGRNAAPPANVDPVCASVANVTVPR